MLTRQDWQFCLAVVGIPTGLLILLEARMALLLYFGI